MLKTTWEGNGYDINNYNNDDEFDIGNVNSEANSDIRKWW